MGNLLQVRFLFLAPYKLKTKFNREVLEPKERPLGNEMPKRLVDQFK